MDAIQKLKEEHTVILRMLSVIRKACMDILETKEVKDQLFRTAIDFVRCYADKYHHSKEEDVLFKKMQEEIADKDSEAAIQGMFIEHDLGRAYIYNLEKALDQVKQGNQEAKIDIIGNAIAYTDLLKRHIFKEDHVLYDFGRKTLKPETIEEVNRISQGIDDQPENIEKRKQYINLISELEKQFCIAI